MTHASDVAPVVFTLRLEAIGDSYVQWRRAAETGRARNIPRTGTHPWRLMMRSRPVWVARITGWTPAGAPVREFLRAHRDYSEASRNGNRGVYYVYGLVARVLYEIQQPTALGRHRRYYATVARGADGRVALRELPAAGARAWEAACH